MLESDDSVEMCLEGLLWIRAASDAINTCRLQSGAAAARGLSCWIAVTY